MKRDLSQLAWAFVTGIVLAVAAVHWAGCSGAQGTADARVRSALDMVAVVVDPAYAFAVDGCAARQALVADAVEAGRTSPDEGLRELGPIRARCQATRRAFDAIRAGHAEAARLVEAGELARAEALLAEIRAEWTALKGGVP